MAAAPSAAMTELKVQVVGDAAQADPVTVTLAAPDGTTATFEDEDGDGVIAVSPEGPAGNYRVTIARGEASVTRTVTLLDGGEVSLTWSAGDQVEVTYSGSLRSEEEITVTARKREESLQAIPIAITAFTPEALEARSMRDLSDIGDSTPNVDFSIGNGLGGGTSEATVYIRGIGQIDTALFTDPGVGIYVDGVYLARASGSVLDLLDLERIEILRGSQGTYFGKNTTGGAISLITRKPSAEKLFDLELTVGELDRIDGILRAGGALTESVFASVTAAATNRDGFAESLETGELYDDDDRQSIRGALRWLASESVVFDLSAEITREREAAANQAFIAFENTPLIDFYNGAIVGAGLPGLESYISDDPRLSWATAPNQHDGDVGGVTATVTWSAGAVDLTSITAYREIEFDVAGDGDGSPLTLAQRSFLQRQDQISQEMHLAGGAADDRLRWLVGGLYFTESSNEDSLTLVFGDLFAALEAAPGPIYAPPGLPNFLCSPGPPPPGLPCFGGAGNPFNFGFFFGDGDFERIALETTSWALFGEGTWAVSDKLSATLGLRYTFEEKEFDFFRDPGAFGAPDVRLFNEDDWDAVSPRFNFAYQASENSLLYLSAARGFRSGGFNGRPQDRLALDSYDPEDVWTYEVGWKTDALDDRLRLNGAAFYSDYSDIQFTASLNVGGMPVFVIQNAGKGEATGFELELSARPNRGLDLALAVGYIDTEYTELENLAPGGATLDGVFPKTPEWTFAFSPQYAFPVKGGGTVTLRADYSYRDDVFNDISNTPAIAQDGYSLVNARVAWASQSDDWQVALFGTNLADESYLEHGFFAAAFGSSLGVSGRPREWGLSVRRRF
ncbi:MAG: TonB-dependent receptor [bacterium]|nr:TonB-dependent receptor [bacterium]